jgi:nucleoporin POM152
MNGTPARRGVGGFPSTPQTTNRSPGVRSPQASTPRPNVRSNIQDVPTAAPQSSSGPLIPSHILDPAQQRFYVFALYIGLWAYRSYDFYTLIVEEDQSLYLCLKWCFFDMLFMFGVPLLEIPWLEWSNAGAFLLFVLHAVVDVILMFKIGVPVQAWSAGLLYFLWGGEKEHAISGTWVKPDTILHNASLILGKQIINILPEGSAILNPDKQPFCLSSTIAQLEIPILINQTEPIEMELLRIDVETNVNETITIKKKELGKMLDKARKSAKKSSKTLDPDDPLTLRYTIKKTGVYLLKKVVDQSKLQVRPRASSMVVATCPQARVKPSSNRRCRNDLSNMALEVEGTPPLSIKYHLAVNGQKRGGSEFQNLQSDDAISPLSRHSSQALVKSGREDVTWARSQKIMVPLNETVTISGLWEYEVEEVQDGFGNVVNFAAVDDDERPRHKGTGLRQAFEVHERPTIFLRGCSPQSPIKVAKNNVEKLPVAYSSTSKKAIEAPHVISYLFTPEKDIVTDGYHSQDATLKKETMRSIKEQPLIRDAGLYTLQSVSTEFCEGEVLEPMSCLLQNPPEPALSLTSDDIFDKCAGNPIGLRVSLNLVGSPPFNVYYSEYFNGRKKPTQKISIASLRWTTELVPKDAGHYKYIFESISDAVYKDVPVRNIELQQNVRPSAHARFVEGKRAKSACIDDKSEFDVRLSGDAPWKLEYEIVHNGKRAKHSIETSEEHYTITTDELKSGGEYVVTLTSVSDKAGCKEYLQEEARVNVRHERPKAYFGHIEGRQTVKDLEGRNVGLPLRFTGNGPWRLTYENLATNEVKKEDFQTANSYLDVKTDGTYQLLSIKDNFCPGVIEEKASQFEVSWVARPLLSIAESPAVIIEGGKYIKDPVCEGEEDTFDISLSGKLIASPVFASLLTCL